MFCIQGMALARLAAMMIMLALPGPSNRSSVRAVKTGFYCLAACFVRSCVAKASTWASFVLTRLDRFCQDALVLACSIVHHWLGSSRVGKTLLHCDVLALVSFLDWNTICCGKQFAVRAFHSEEELAH